MSQEEGAEVVEEEDDEEEANNTFTNPQWNVIIVTNLDISSRNVQVRRRERNLQ